MAILMSKMTHWIQCIFSKPLIITALCIFSFGSGFAQQNKYIVYFIDEKSEQHTISNPEAFLSERAIARRKKQDIAIKKRDLPVKSSFIEGLKDTGAKFYYASKWFNAALIEANEAMVNQVENLDYTTEVELVYPAQDTTSDDTTSSPDSGGSGANGYQFKPQKNNDSFSTEDQLQMLGIDDMHQQGYNGEGMFVAIFDGGFRGADEVSFLSHIRDQNKFIANYNFVGNEKDVYKYGQHGTQALSCFAAYQPKNLVGGSYASDFMLCVTEDGSSEYPIEEYNWLFAAERADSAGVDVINTSLGYTTFDDPSMDHKYEDLDGKTTPVSKAASIASNTGMICVISAGNEGASDWKYISAPADGRDILAVGAVTMNRNRIYFSSTGPSADGRTKPDVSALGFQTVVGDANGNVTVANGTSFAAPLVTGFTASLWQANPDLTNTELIERIRLTSSNAYNPNNKIGYGIPDFTRAHNNILAASVKNRLNPHFNVYPNPVQENTLYVKPKDERGLAPLKIILQSSTGRVIRQINNPEMEDGTIKIDVGNLTGGVYILKILSEKATDTIKLIRF